MQRHIPIGGVLVVIHQCKPIGVKGITLVALEMMQEREGSMSENPSCLKGVVQFAPQAEGDILMELDKDAAAYLILDIGYWIFIGPSA